jgi:hypothetical protein
MNKNALLLIPLALILSGCGEKPEEAATAPEAAEEAAAPEQMACVTRVIPPNCIPIHANPIVMLNTSGMLAVPPNACVAAGTTVEFTITPDPGALNTVEIWPKDENDTWLAGWNSGSSDKIVITVPASVPNQTDHDYGWTNHTTGECVDPRMRVDDQGPIEAESPADAGVNIDETLDENMDKAELPDD